MDIKLIEYFLIILVLIGLWFIFREVNCWYFKINEMLKVLKSIESKLGSEPGKTGNWVCPNCKEINPTDVSECPKCHHKFK